MLFKALLAAAMALPPYYRDKELPEVRQQRLEIIAHAVSNASAQATCAAGSPKDCRPIWPGSRRELAFLLLTQAWYETRLAAHIHRDECGPHECDAYRVRGRTLHRSKSLWQLQASYLLPRAEWQELGGVDLDSTTRAAWYAARMLSTNRRRCAQGKSSWVSATIAGYARGDACEWAPAEKRAKLWQKLISKY